MIIVGSKVSCRLYNSPDKAYYGEMWAATVLKVDHRNFVGCDFAGGHASRPYLVNRPNGIDVWLSDREIDLKEGVKCEKK